MLANVAHSPAWTSHGYVCLACRQQRLIPTRCQKRRFTSQVTESSSPADDSWFENLNDLSDTYGRKSNKPVAVKASSSSSKASKPVVARSYPSTNKSKVQKKASSGELRKIGTEELGTIDTEKKTSVEASSSSTTYRDRRKAAREEKAKGIAKVSKKDDVVTIEPMRVVGSEETEKVLSKEEKTAQLIAQLKKENEGRAARQDKELASQKQSKARNLEDGGVRAVEELSQAVVEEYRSPIRFDWDSQTLTMSPAFGGQPLPASGTPSDQPISLVARHLQNKRQTMAWGVSNAPISLSSNRLPLRKVDKAAQNSTDRHTSSKEVRTVFSDRSENIGDILADMARKPSSENAVIEVEEPSQQGDVKGQETGEAEIKAPASVEADKADQGEDLEIQRSEEAEAKVRSVEEGGTAQKEVAEGQEVEELRSYVPFEEEGAGRQEAVEGQQVDEVEVKVPVFAERHVAGQRDEVKRQETEDAEVKVSVSVEADVAGQNEDVGHQENEQAEATRPVPVEEEREGRREAVEDQHLVEAEEIKVLPSVEADVANQSGDAGEQQSEKAEAKVPISVEAASGENSQSAEQLAEQEREQRELHEQIQGSIQAHEPVPEEKQAQDKDQEQPEEIPAHGRLSRLHQEGRSGSIDSKTESPVPTKTNQRPRSEPGKPGQKAGGVYPGVKHYRFFSTQVSPKAEKAGLTRKRRLGLKPSKTMKSLEKAIDGSPSETTLGIKDAMLGTGAQEKEKDASEAVESSSEPPAEEREETPANAAIMSIEPGSLNIEPLDIPQPPVPYLEYGLDRVLFNPGVYQLQDPASRVYNFDPYLQKIMPVVEFDFDSLEEYKTSSQDQALAKLAKDQNKRYIGSTSSMTSSLAHFHYLLSNWRNIGLDMLSDGFVRKTTKNSFTEINRAPSAIFLRWKNGTYAIDADKEYDGANVLMLLGKSMELLLTLPTSEYERYRKSDPRKVSEEQKTAPESYQYTTMRDFLMRSQLDAYDPRLPGTGTFDLKTRAVVSVRMQSQDFEPMTGYEIYGLHGKFGSYEREYYDMMRATMLKYMLQARMGRMNGIFVAYHNVKRMFGFQYIPIHEMDRALHGQTDPCLGDQEFKASLEIMNELFNKATAKFPNQSLRFHFETMPLQSDGMPTTLHCFAEPMSEEDIDEIQNSQKAKIQEFERNIMGKNDDGATPSPSTSEPAAEPAQTRDNSSTLSTNSDADASFLKSISSSQPNENLKPLFYAKVIVQTKVNGETVPDDRPKNLKRDDKWEIEYILKDYEITPHEWALYEDCRARRKYALTEREDEDGADAESEGKAKRSDGYINLLKDMAEKGRVFRDRMDEMEAGKEAIRVDQPLPREREVIDGVEDYMKWMYGKE